MTAFDADLSIKTASPRHTLSFLAALSGSCGLAYEILLTRLFSNYFGDGFIITGVTVCAVFWGIAFGAWQSQRFLPHLWLIELCIGLYAIVVTVVFLKWGFDLASISDVSWINGLILLTLLGLPSFLIGTCVPIFSAYLETSTNIKAPFHRIYGFYNAGAFVSILIIEFVFFRLFGLKATILIIAFQNLFIAHTLTNFSSITSRKSSSVLIEKNSRHSYWPLLTVSVLSGVFQLYTLRLTFSIFGPLHENFAIILAIALLGIFLGTWLAKKNILTFRLTAMLLVLSLLTLLISISLFIDTWSYSAQLKLDHFGELLIKLGLIVTFLLPSFVLFGAFVPLVVTANKGETLTLSRRALTISSFGNGVGALLMFLLLHKVLSLLQIGLVLTIVATFVALPYWANKAKPRYIVTAITGLIVMVILIIQSWPQVELLLGYRSLMYPDIIQHRKKTYNSAHIYKAFDQDAVIAHFKNNNSSLILNGYRSLSFSPESRTTLHESIVGSTPALFSQNTHSAIVFGLGSGITAGATAKLYKQTKVVELNPAMLHVPSHFTAENQNVMHQPNVEILVEDGISTLLNSNKKYDAIINTVTSPQYYSAAKLYTQDFYKIVKKHLQDGGVYSGWFDININQKGIAIMLNTLEASFTDCKHFLLSTGYFNTVCGDSKLDYLPEPKIIQRTEHTTINTLLKKHQFTDGFNETMQALEIDFSQPFFPRNSRTINTLDRPALEFTVARKRDISDLLIQIKILLDSNIELYRKKTNSINTRKKCEIVAHMRNAKDAKC